jgi:hypothetical protein
MNDNDFEMDKLFEELTLEKTRELSSYTPFHNFGKNPKWWDWWGNYLHPIPLYRNPKHKMDTIYKNKDGKFHRIYGPAFTSGKFRAEIWYKDGEFHREDGPAYIHGYNMVWFKEGKLHRLGGPAVITDAGPKQYWIDGVRYPHKEYNREIRRRKRKGLI